MKAYVFGGEKDELIGLANRLNESGATALIGMPEEGLEGVASRIGKSFDCAVMISDAPIKASVQANRDSKFRAAPCYDQKALQASANEGINLFILEASVARRLDISIIAGSSRNLGAREPEPERHGAGHSILKAVGRAQSGHHKVDERPPKRVQKPGPERQDRSEDDEEAPRQRSGIKGRLRDIFGIEEV